MSNPGFDQLERALESGGAPAAFDLLAENFRREKKYPLLFETMIMTKRHELGLPLISTGGLEDLAVLGALEPEVARRKGVHSEVRLDPGSQMRRELCVHPEDQAASTG